MKLPYEFVINDFFLILVDCIWKYMRCARDNRPEAECKSEFNQCSMGPLNADDSEPAM